MAGSTRTVEKGFIESYARPGENITGLDWWPAPALAEQHFQILKSAVPSAMRAVRLVDPITYLRSDEHVRSVSAKIGLTLLSVELNGADDLVGALDRIAALKPDVLSVFGSDVIRPHYREIAEFAAKQKLVSMAGVGYAAADGLLQHSAHRQAMLDRLASYIDRILRDANPASLPVEQPTKYELVLNGKTAKTMGVTFPPAFLTHVDRVIE